MLWRVVKVKNSVSVEKINAFSYGHHSGNSKTHNVHAGWTTEKKRGPQIYLAASKKKTMGIKFIRGDPVLSHFQSSTEIVLLVVE